MGEREWKQALFAYVNQYNRSEVNGAPQPDEYLEVGQRMERAARTDPDWNSGITSGTPLPYVVKHAPSRCELYRIRQRRLWWMYNCMSGSFTKKAG